MQAASYGAELQKAMKQKQDQDNMERMNRQSERNSMLRMADANSLNDLNKQQINLQQRRMNADLTKQQINIRDREANQMRANEKMTDKQMIEFDNMKAREYQDHQKYLREQQKQILKDANLA